LQLTHGGVYGFARNMMGDEQLLYAFYDCPELVHDLMDSYTDMILAIWDRMVREVEFDLIEFWEDMASKNGCLISPDTFREFMLPNYRRVATFAKEHGIEILLVDSDGYIDDLAPVMMEGGITAMYPFEVGAGCDVVQVRRRYPSLGIIGGLSKEAMIYGKDAMDKELEKARRYIKLGRFIPGPDHFVLSSVPWSNYRYFMERLREIIMTTPL
jgi:uroporphyrinogen decarboxylase